MTQQDLEHAAAEYTIGQIEKKLFAKLDLWNNEAYMSSISKETKAELSKQIDNLQIEYSQTYLTNQPNHGKRRP